MHFTFLFYFDVASSHIGYRRIIRENSINACLKFGIYFIFFLLTPVIPSYGAITFTGTELLGRPIDHSITLNVIADPGIQAYVEDGTAAGVYANKTGIFKIRCSAQISRFSPKPRSNYSKIPAGYLMKTTMRFFGNRMLLLMEIETFVLPASTRS
jgi:hypothetical protein